MGTPSTQWHEVLSQNTEDTKLSHNENPNFLSLLVLKCYRVVTDGQNYHSNKIMESLSQKLNLLSLELQGSQDVSFLFI